MGHGALNVVHTGGHILSRPPKDSSAENLFQIRSVRLTSSQDIFNIWSPHYPDPNFRLPMFVHPSHLSLVLYLVSVYRVHPLGPLFLHICSEGSLSRPCLSSRGDWHSHATMDAMLGDMH